MENEVSTVICNNRLSEITIHPEIIAELGQIERRMTELSDSDDDLIGMLVLGIFFIYEGKVSYSKVEQIIWEKYPSIHTDSKLLKEKKHELFKLIYHLNKIVRGGHEKTIEERKKFLDLDYKDFIKEFRVKLKEIVFQIFFPGSIETNDEITEYDMVVMDEEDNNIIGETKEKLNNMEV